MKALDLGIDTTTSAGKLLSDIFASFAGYDRKSIIERTKARQGLAKKKGIYIGRPAGINKVNYGKVKTGLENGLSVTKIVNLTGISKSSVKRYRKVYESEKIA